VKRFTPSTNRICPKTRLKLTEISFNAPSPGLNINSRNHSVYWLCQTVGRPVIQEMKLQNYKATNQSEISKIDVSFPTSSSGSEESAHFLLVATARVGRRFVPTGGDESTSLFILESLPLSSLSGFFLLGSALGTGLGFGFDFKGSGGRLSKKSVIEAEVDVEGFIFLGAGFTYSASLSLSTSSGLKAASALQ
jgi:hypothetical protein